MKAEKLGNYLFSNFADQLQVEIKQQNIVSFIRKLNMHHSSWNHNFTLHSPFSLQGKGIAFYIRAQPQLKYIMLHMKNKNVWNNHTEHILLFWPYL